MLEAYCKGTLKFRDGRDQSSGSCLWGGLGLERDCLSKRQTVVLNGLRMGLVLLPFCP